MKDEEKNITIIEHLERGNGEVDFSKLNDGDKFQLLTRYLNELCSITKSLLQIMADEYVLTEFICKNLGIDVKSEKAELARRIKAQMDENLQKSKEQLENLSEQKA